ncbi:hypothetical protein Tco_0261571 [Tanacetum coccineum]
MVPLSNLITALAVVRNGVPKMKGLFSSSLMSKIMKSTGPFVGYFEVSSDVLLPREIHLNVVGTSRVDVRTYLLGGVIDGSEVNGIIRNPKLELESSCFTFDLVPLSYESVDVIIGENWLLRHKAEMVWHEKVFNTCLGNLEKCLRFMEGRRKTNKEDRGLNRILVMELVQGRRRFGMVVSFNCLLESKRGCGMIAEEVASKEEVIDVEGIKWSNERSWHAEGCRLFLFSIYDVGSNDLKQCLEKGREGRRSEAKNLFEIDVRYPSSLEKDCWWHKDQDVKSKRTRKHKDVVWLGPTSVKEMERLWVVEWSHLGEVFVRLERKDKLGTEFRKPLMLWIEKVYEVFVDSANARGTLNSGLKFSLGGDTVTNRGLSRSDYEVALDTCACKWPTWGIMRFVAIVCELFVGIFWKATAKIPICKMRCDGGKTEELNDIPVALVARFGVVSKSTDRILVSHGG